MKNLPGLLFSIAIIAWSCPAIVAQDAKIDEILSVRLQDSGSLQEGGVVRGFYFLYQKHSDNKDNSAFALQIHDANMNLLKTKNVSVKAGYYVVNVSSNGSTIVLKFADDKTKTYLFKGYDFAGESLFSKTVVWDRLEAAMNELGKPLAIHPIPGAGYVNYLYTHEQKGEPSYQINFLSDMSDSVDHWSLQGRSELAEMASHLGADESTLYFAVVRGKTLRQADLDVFLVAVDVKTGKKSFEVKIETPKNRYLPFAAYKSDDGELRVVGRYYAPDASPTSDRELGFALLGLDAQGKIVRTSHQPYDLTEDNLRPFFEEFIQLPDGRTLAVAETYGARIDAAGILLGGSSPIKYIVEDLIIFEFDKDFKLLNKKVYDKYKSNIELPGLMVGNPLLILNMFEAWGSFDYSYYQISDDGTSVAIGYLDYERRKGEKNNTVLAAAFVTDTGYSSDKFDLSSDADESRVMPGPFGKVVVLEYYRKEKELKILTKNLNY